MSAPTIPTIITGETQAPSGNTATGNTTIHISLDKLGSISPNDVLTLEFIENLSTTSTVVSKGENSLPEIMMPTENKQPIIKVQLSSGQVIEVAADDISFDKPVNIDKGTLLQAKVSSINEQGVTIRLQNTKIEGQILPETLENAGIKNIISEQPTQQGKTEVVIKNDVFQGIKTEILPLRLSQAIEQIAKEINLSPKLVNEIKTALNGFEIRFDAPKNIENPVVRDNPQQVMTMTKGENAINILFSNIREIASQNQPVSKAIETIVNAFKALEGKTLPAQTQDYPQGTVFKTAIGNIFPEKDIKLPQNIKLELPVKEIKEVIENKLDELLRADFWKFSTVGKSETKAEPEVLKEIFRLLKNENLDSKIPQPESKDFFANIRGFIKAVKTAEVSQWLGRETTQEILNLPKGQETISVLQNFIDSSHREVGLWRIVEIPIVSGETIEQIRLAVKRQTEEDEENEENQKENPKKGGTRFVVESRFSRLGGFQFDGLADEKKRRFDLIIRTEKLLEEDLCSQIMRLYKTTLHKFEYWGTIQINLKENFIKPWEDEAKEENKGQGILV